MSGLDSLKVRVNLLKARLNPEPKQNVNSFHDEENSFIRFIKRWDVEILIAAITIVTIACRLFMLRFVSDDYTDYLSNWYQQYYFEGFRALGRQIGDYTPAYNYFLYLISLLRIAPGSTFRFLSMTLNPVNCLIKLFSSLFDFGIGIQIYFIVKKLTGSRIRGAIGYAITDMGLTVICNSALWGQCDSIYGFFAILCIWFVLEDRPGLSWLSFSISFAFKLQAVFILPALLVLWLRGKTQIRYVVYVPLVYLIFALPAAIAGGVSGAGFLNRLGEVFKIYNNQSGSNTNATNNAGTFLALIYKNYAGGKGICTFSLVFAFVLNILLALYLIRFRAPLKDGTVIKIFLLFSMTVPYFLPHMHERYFYLADLIMGIYVFMHPKRVILWIVQLFNSFTGYAIYLWDLPLLGFGVRQHWDTSGGANGLSLRISSALYLLAIGYVVYDLFKEEIEEEKRFAIEA